MSFKLLPIVIAFFFSLYFVYKVVTPEQQYDFDGKMKSAFWMILCVVVQVLVLKI